MQLPYYARWVQIVDPPAGSERRENLGPLRVERQCKALMDSATDALFAIALKKVKVRDPIHELFGALISNKHRLVIGDDQDLKLGNLIMDIAIIGKTKRA